MTIPGLETDPVARSLYRAEPLRRPLMQAMIDALQLPAGSQGLDVGCGIGLQTRILAKVAGPQGHVTGLDASPALLEVARALAGQEDFGQQVNFQEGDWNQLPFENGTVDWVWSADAAGYAAREPVPVIRELARVIRPGGRLVLAYWSSQTLLPGYPALEARLNASRAGIAPFSMDAQPEAHFMRTLGRMQAAGLSSLWAGTFVHSVFAPLEESLREALIDLLQMRWEGAEADLSPGDWSAYQQISQPGSPGFILDQPGYHAFFTYSVFSGMVP